MDAQQYLAFLERKKTHTKKKFWQIWTPFIISCLAIVTVAVFIVILTFSPANTDFHTKWSGISIVFMSLPALFFALLILVVVIGVIYLVARITNLVPGYTELILYYLRRANLLVLLASNKISTPFIFLKSKSAGLKILFRKKK